MNRKDEFMTGVAAWCSNRPDDEAVSLVSEIVSDAILSGDYSFEQCDVLRMFLSWLTYSQYVPLEGILVALSEKGSSGCLPLKGV